MSRRPTKFLRNPIIRRNIVCLAWQGQRQHKVKGQRTPRPGSRKPTKEKSASNRCFCSWKKKDDSEGGTKSSEGGAMSQRELLLDFGTNKIIYQYLPGWISEWLWIKDTVMPHIPPPTPFSRTSIAIAPIPVLYILGTWGI